MNHPKTEQPQTSAMCQLLTHGQACGRVQLGSFSDLDQAQLSSTSSHSQQVRRLSLQGDLDSPRSPLPELAGLDLLT
jgi:hypothetical protein